MNDSLDFVIGGVIALFLVCFFGVIGFAVYQDAHLAKECIAAGKTYSDGECK